MTVYNNKISITLFLLASSLLLFTSACDEDDSDETVSGKRTSGFVLVGETASDTYLAKYIEELPTTSVDLSDGTDFSFFIPNSISDNAIFLPNTDRSSGFLKYIVNAEGELVEEGFIPTISPDPSRIDVRDGQLGVFQDPATPDQITIFNPTSFEIESTIDMSKGFVPGDADPFYFRFYFKENQVYCVVGDAGQDWYRSLFLHRANLATRTFEGDTRREGNGLGAITYLPTLGRDFTDAEGNLYVIDAGNFEGAGIPGRINKIPVGSNEIDPDYIFEPSVVINPENNFLPVFNELFILRDGSGRAIARVNTETPEEARSIVVAAGGVSNLSPDQLQNVRNILFASRSARWCELDLNTRSVTPIEGIPSIGPFFKRNVFEHEGQIYVPVVTNAPENAYYRYDPSTGVSEKAFDVLGADIQGIYKLEDDN